MHLIFFLSVRLTSDYFAREVLKKYRYVLKKCVCLCVCVYVRECVCVCVGGGGVCECV